MTVVQDGEDNYFQYCAVNNDSNCTDINGNAHGWAAVSYTHLTLPTN